MGVLDLLLPTTCPVCRRPGAAPCRPCAAGLARAPALPPPPGVDRCHCLLAYDGNGRAVVAALKYRGARSALAWVVDGLGALVAAPGGGPAPAVVCWVPVLPAHRAQRGVDGGELVARALAQRIGRPAAALLRRRPGPTQAGRTAAERRRGPRLVVARVVVAPSVLVVDDVVTTGASVAAAARVLRAAGAATVHVAAVARTPPPADRRHPPGGLT